MQTVYLALVQLKTSKDMVLLKLVKKVKNIDKFTAQRFVTYKSQQEYTTLCGGISTVMIIVMVLLLGISELRNMLDKKEITASTSSVQEGFPSNVNINFANGSPSMFALIFNANGKYNLTNYFDVNGYLVTDESRSNAFKFVPCQKDSFTYSQETIKTFDFGYLRNYGLCPPSNMAGLIGGKAGSANYAYLQIEIFKCNSSNITCKSPTEIQQLLNDSLTITVAYLNTIIDPSNKDWRRTIMDTGSTFTIRDNSTLALVSQMTQQSIKYETHFWPWQNFKQQKISAISSVSLDDIGSTSTGLVSLKIQKAVSRVRHTQDFKKIDDVLSYVGGLIGSLIPLFFVLNWFADKSFLISVAQKVFNFNKVKSIDSNKYNFFQYVKMSARYWGKKCGGYKQDWRQMDRQIQSKSESDRSAQKDQNLSAIFEAAEENMSEQLSIDLILQQIKYLQAAISMLLTQNQMKALHLLQRQSLKTAQEARQYFQISNRYFFDKKVRLVNKPKRKRQVEQNEKTTKPLQDDKDLFNNQNGGQLGQPAPLNDQLQAQQPATSLDVIPLDGSHSAAKQKQSQPKQDPMQNQQSQISQAQKASSFLQFHLISSILDVLDRAKNGDPISYRIITHLSERALKELKLKDEVQKLHELFGYKHTNHFLASISKLESPIKKPLPH